MIIEGKNSVYEALVAGTTFNKLMVSKGLTDDHSNKIIDLARQKGIFITFVDKKVLDRSSETGRHQGFVADITDFVYNSVEDILSCFRRYRRPTQPRQHHKSMRMCWCTRYNHTKTTCLQRKWYSYKSKCWCL